MAKAKGSAKTGGRQRGTPNKVTAELKDMILQALDNAGGVEHLQKQANDNLAAFLTLVGKVLPMTVNGSGAGGEIVIRWANPGEVA